MSSTAEMEVPSKEKKQEVEVAIFELAEQNSSGFIQEGTENLPEPIEIKGPKWRKVLNKSHFRDGVKNVDIRYINGVDEILVDEQNKFNYTAKANPRRDMIIFKDCNITVAREGKLIGMVDFLRTSSFCGTNPKRDKSVPILWNEIFPEKTKTDVNEKAFAESDAIALVRSLVKKGADGYEYEEEKIIAYCNLLGATADSPAGRVNTLISKAKQDPVLFLEKIRSFDQTFITEIMMAEEFGVIAFEPTSVGYVAKEKLIITYSSKLNKDKKVQLLAAHFQSFEGQEAYREFTVELNAQREKGTSKQ